MAESMSIETEYGCRFILRDPNGAPIEHQEREACDVPETVSALRARTPAIARSPAPGTDAVAAEVFPLPLPAAAPRCRWRNGDAAH